MSVKSVLVVLGVVLLALLLIVLLLLGVRHCLRRRRRLAETGELRKDLYAWRNISALAQGGDEARRAKADLSTRLGNLASLFGLGQKMLKDSHGDRNQPWVLFVGEPDAGKSTLLANSGLELRPGVRLDSTERHPLVPWLAPNAYALDVGGRVFFDRWLEGSGAEWDETISLLKRHRSRRPLDGVVLCVPADALLADDESLTREKTSLVSSELRRLVTRLGANVPCHVVVTKCDMLLGWREYFATLTENQRKEAFGWRNETPQAAFDLAKFGAWWEAAAAGMRDGAILRMGAGDGSEQAAQRLATYGRAYRLSDAFEGLRANLGVYLSRIFGTEAWHGRDQLLLTGVFFTAALDSGTTLSPEFATFQGKRVEEALFQADPVETFGGCFVRDLLHDFVFGRRLTASFTAAALFRRQLPGYLVAAGILALGVIWLMTGLRSKGGLAAKLAGSAAFFDEVSARFDNHEIEASPLCEPDERGGLVMLDNEPMAGSPGLSRLRFLHLAKNEAEESHYAGFGWSLSSVLRFGFNLDMAARERRGVFNRIQSEMVFVPLMYSFERHELQSTSKSFSAARRLAFSEYNMLSVTLDEETPKVSDMGCFVRYLNPEANPDTVQLISTYYPGCGGVTRDYDASVVYDLDYIKVERRLYNDFFRAWSDLEIYPETTYPVLRCAVTNAAAFMHTGQALQKLAAGLQLDPAKNEETLATWRATLAQQKRRNLSIAESRELLANFSPAPVESAGDGGSKASETLVDPIVEAIRDYRSRLQRDRQEIEHEVAIAASQQNSHVANSYYRLLSPDRLRSRFNQIGERLEAEAERLIKVGEELRAGGVVRMLKAKPDAKSAEGVASAFAFDVMVGLYAAAAKMPTEDRLTDPVLLGDMLARQEAHAKSVFAEFDAALGPWGGDPGIQSVAKMLRAFMTAQVRENRLRVLRDYVQVHPRTPSELRQLVMTTGQPPDVRARELAVEQIGPVDYPSGLCWDSAERLFKAYAQVLPIMSPAPQGEKAAQDGKDGTKAAGKQAEPVPVIPEYAELADAMEKYLTQYLETNGELVDRLGASFGTDWKSFRAHCAVIKPYAVNTMLQSLYMKTREGLSAVPEVCLSPEQKERRTAYLAAIDKRIKLLNPLFTETAIRQASAWALLSEDPVLAAKQLRETPAKTLLTDYFAVVSAEDGQNVPWWTTYFMRGLLLAQREALEQGVASLRKQGCKYLRFPLCRDPVVTDEVLTEDGLAHANDALLSCGCTPPSEKADQQDPAPKTAGKPVPVADESGNPILRQVRGSAVLDVATGVAKKSPIDLERGSAMLGIIDALSVHKFETVWTLTVPALAKRAELQRRFFPSLPLATVRYRYGEVSVGGKLRGEPAALDSTEEVEFARGDMSDANIRLKFREFSDEPDVVAESSFAGPWAILRLYFQPGSQVDAKTKTVYIPLIVRDRYDLKSVFWVTLKFSRPLPSPADWPSTDNWIDSAAPKAAGPTSQKVK